LWQQATLEIMLRHIYMGVVLRAHPVRGESRIQRNANGEVATVQTQNCKCNRTNAKGMMECQRRRWSCSGDVKML